MPSLTFELQTLVITKLLSKTPEADYEAAEDDGALLLSLAHRGHVIILQSRESLLPPSQ